MEQKAVEAWEGTAERDELQENRRQKTKDAREGMRGCQWLSLCEGHWAGKRLWRKTLSCCHPVGSCLWGQEDPLWLVKHQCLTTAWDTARMKLLGNHRQNQESVGQCGSCQPAPLHPLFLQGGDEEQSQGPVSQLSHQLQAQEVSMATSPQQLRDCQRSSSCRWGWKEQVGVPACDPGGNSPEWVPALMLLETWMSSGSAHLKGTSLCPRREDVLGLHILAFQIAARQLPVLSFSACLDGLFSPSPPRRRSVLCPPAPRGPPLSPSLLLLALRAGARHLLGTAAPTPALCDSMGCQESSVWHGLRWRWERADSSTRGSLQPWAALPLLSTKLSPRQPIQKLLFGVGLALLGLPGPGVAAMGQVLP